MVDLPTQLDSLILLVFALGVRHGLDADHLATIDGLTRYNLIANPKISRWCGFLFSIGHGVVVTASAVFFGMVTHTWGIPSWLEVVGACTSIIILLLLGLLNLNAVIKAKPNEMVESIGLKSRWLSSLQNTHNPLLILVIGALFAFSFDTMSLSALFSFTATQYGSVMFALLLGLVFTLGMTITDGVNGFWISRLLNRTNQLAFRSSQIMGLTVSLLSFAVAAITFGKLVSPLLSEWSERNGILLPVSACVIILFGFGIALRSSKIPKPATGFRVESWADKWLAVYRRN